MELGSQIRAIKKAANRRGTAESFSLPASTVITMIPEPHEPFDSNKKGGLDLLSGCNVRCDLALPSLKEKMLISSNQ